MNEEQRRSISSQRLLFSSKQEELNQLARRIEELHQRLNGCQTSRWIDPFIRSADHRTLLDSVQHTWKQINMGDIELRLLQLANSFAVTHSSSIHPNDQIQHLNSSDEVS